MLHSMASIFFISIVFIISCFVHKRKVRKEAFVDKKADYTTRRQHIITCSLNAISGSCLSTIDNTLNALLTSTTRTLTRPFEEIWGTFWACSFTICIGLFACLDKGVIQPSNYMLQGRSSHWISLTTFWIKIVLFVLLQFKVYKYEYVLSVAWVCQSWQSVIAREISTNLDRT